MKNGHKPINPILDWNELKADTAGLTKREYFAGLAMQGLMANSHNEVVSLSESEIAEWAIGVADELLKQLEK